MTQEWQIRIAISASSFMVGVIVGYIFFHRSKNNKTLTALQILSIAVFFAYLGLTAFQSIHYSDLVAITILAITGGEPLGKALARYQEKKNEDKKD